MRACVRACRRLGRPFPTPANSGTTRILNNVFVSDRDSPYYTRMAAGGQAERNTAIMWNGFTPAQMERNVFVINASSAPSRQAWFNGSPCASNPADSAAAARWAAASVGSARPRSANCTWDLADSFRGASVSNNIYFNASGPDTLSASFPGACDSTQLGPCKAVGQGQGGRSEHVHRKRWNVRQANVAFPLN